MDETPKPQQEFSTEKSDQEKYPRVLTRRQILKRAMFGAVALAGAAATGKLAQIAIEHPELIEKTARSISSGKIVEDVREVIESRLRLGEHQITITNFEAGDRYSTEEWMSEVSDSFQVLEIEVAQENKPLLLFDITDSVSAIPVNKKEEKVDSVNTVFYDILETVDEQKVLTLPGPQYQFQKTSGKDNPYYLQYLMYAWSQNQVESSATECTGKRGGVVVKADGNVLVASPEEFYDFYKKNEQGEQAATTLMEFAFIMDSDDLEGSIEALETASKKLIKDLSHSNTFTNSLITLYKEDGSFQTLLLAAYEPELENQLGVTDESAIRGMSPLQLSSLAEQLKDYTQSSRYVLSIADPSPEASNCYAPLTFTEQELQQKGYGYNKGVYQRWMPNVGVENKYIRTVGSMDTFAFPQYSFPWVLGTKKS